MHPVKAIAVGILAWPAAEIVAFFCVAAALGFVNALLLVILMSVAGFLILRHFGGGRTVQTMQGPLRISAWSGSGVAPGLGGILLLIPGFLTSVLAVLILFPVSRRWLLAGFGRLFAPGRRRRRPSGADVIELAPSEWKPLPGTTLPPDSKAAEKPDVTPRNQF